jgi:hypothetical protein
LFRKSKSGNHEVIEDIPPQPSTAVQTERKAEAIPFQKPVSLLPANMRTTSIKETLEKHTQKLTEKEEERKNNTRHTSA